MFTFKKNGYPHLSETTSVHNAERTFDLLPGYTLNDCTKEELIALVRSLSNEKALYERRMMLQIEEMVWDFECLKAIKFLPKRAVEIIKKWTIE